jgi:hypothetical protein
MAMLRTGKGVTYARHRPQPVRILLFVASAIALGFLLVFVSFPFLFSAISKERKPKYLYWGSRIDCPGKCCDECAGLAHQESSLRCALEEALVLNRYLSNFCKGREISGMLLVLMRMLSCGACLID